MYALLIADKLFALREAALFHRLEVALADEGVAVLLALPETLGQPDRRSLINEPILYRPASLLVPRSVRVRQFLRRIAARSERAKPDIVHCFGGSAWQFANDAAQALGAGRVFELWRSGMVNRARSFRGGSDDRVVFTAPDRWIERQLIRDRTGLRVRLAPWGGVLTPEPVGLMKTDRDTALMLIGNGRDTQGTRAAFDGLAPLLADRPGVMLFVDALAAQRAGLWRRARDAGVLDKVSLIERMEDARDLVLRADILLAPERTGEHRTIILDAMGAAAPIVAYADERIGALIDARTARLIDEPLPGAWRTTVAALLDDPDAAHALGRSAREFIRNDRRFSTYAAAIHEVYEWLCSSEPLPFRADPASRTS